MFLLDLPAALFGSMELLHQPDSGQFQDDIHRDALLIVLGHIPPHAG